MVEQLFVSQLSEACKQSPKRYNITQAAFNSVINPTAAMFVTSTATPNPASHLELIVAWSNVAQQAEAKSFA